MTGSQRQHLKQLIDHHRRQQILEQDEPFGVDRCSRCGVELHDYVADCQTCQDRKRRRTTAKLERERRLLFTGRCRLCGDHTEGIYCHAHSWAANPRASLKGRPAGSSPQVSSPRKSPVGRRFSVVDSMSAGNRHRED